jgi:hypothetical protein
MPAPAAERATQSAVSALIPPTSGRNGPNINPVTGLSTDYLNHFAEVVMVLEMSSTSPECLNDLREWKPKTYVEHFAASRFSNRDEVVAAYQKADPLIRDAMDRASEMLNEALIKTRDIVLRQRAKTESAKAAERSLAWLKPLIARTAAVINGTAPDIIERQGGPQAAVDVIFKR